MNDMSACHCTCDNICLSIVVLSKDTHKVSQATNIVKHITGLNFSGSGNFSGFR